MEKIHGPIRTSDNSVGVPQVERSSVFRDVIRNPVAYFTAIAVHPAIANAAQQMHQSLQAHIADIIAKDTPTVVGIAIVGGLVGVGYNIKELLADVNRARSEEKP